MKRPSREMTAAAVKPKFIMSLIIAAWPSGRAEPAGPMNRPMSWMNSWPTTYMVALPPSTLRAFTFQIRERVERMLFRTRMPKAAMNRRPALLRFSEPGTMIRKRPKNTAIPAAYMAPTIAFVMGPSNASPKRLAKYIIVMEPRAGTRMAERLMAAMLGVR